MTDNNYHTRVNFADPADALGFRANVSERLDALGISADENAVADAVRGALADLPGSHEARLCGPMRGAYVTIAMVARELLNSLPKWARSDTLRLRAFRTLADRALWDALRAEGFVEVPTEFRGAFGGAPIVHVSDLQNLVSDAQRYSATAAIEGPDALRELADALEWSTAELGE